MREDCDDDDDQFFKSNDYDSEEEDDGDVQTETQIGSQISHKNFETFRSSKEVQSGISVHKENSALVSSGNANVLPKSNFQSDVMMNGPCSRRPNLSKITEVPDEVSYSFKHGMDALEMINTNHNKDNYLRLPSMSFHASRYSMKYSWEESALRHQNSIIRPELDLTQIQCPMKTNNTSPLLNKSSKPNESVISTSNKATHNSNEFQTPQNKLQKSEANIILGGSMDLPSASTNPSQSFISGNRYTIYFGFRRLGVDSEETLTIHNINSDGERLEIRFWLKAKKQFKIVYPDEKKTRIMNHDHYLKIVISFTPTAVDHFIDLMYVECKNASNEIRKYKFYVHGYGGCSIIYPSLNDRTGTLRTSANGRHQLVVQSLKNFHFQLTSSGSRVAFASIVIFGSNGELSPQEAMLSPRNLVLYKMEKNQKDIKVIQVKLLSQSSQHDDRRQSSTTSMCTSATTKERPALTIVIFWGEERARQRLKHFERKNGLQMSTFGRNFTRLADFNGEKPNWMEIVEKYVNEEDFYYFERNVKLIFIDVHEEKPVERNGTVWSGGSGSSTDVRTPNHMRTCSAMSVVSSAAGSASNGDLRTHQVIVEVDADTTMIAAAGRININDENDETLTLI